ncbi:MAG: maltotransferase domain-containing protein, partial [Agromyces sp.]
MAPRSRTTVPVAGRIPVQHLRPACPDPRWPAKAFVGELVPFSATVFREGHDAVGALLELTSPSGVARRYRMSSAGPGTDRWQVLVQPEMIGNWHWRVLGFSDDWETWLHIAEVKFAAGVDIDVTRELGARLCDRAAAARGKHARTAAIRAELRALAVALRDPRITAAAVLKSAQTASLRAEFWERPLYELSTYSPEQLLRVERARAGVGSWYEFFP